MTGTTAMPTRAMTRESDMAKRRQKHNLFAVVTAGQEGLYVIWKMDPSARNYDTGFTAKGVWAEEQQAFKAMSAIVARHSALRTKSFFVQGNNKTVLQEVGWRSDEFGWSWWSGGDRGEAMMVLYYGMVGSGRSWNLESGRGREEGLVRVQGFQDGPMYVQIHHIVSDEWSMDQLEKELVQERERARDKGEERMGWRCWRAVGVRRMGTRGSGRARP